MKKDIDYLDEKFPKGKTKFRGEAMVLLTLARQVGKENVVKEYEEYLDDYKKEQRELVRQEVLELIDECKVNYPNDEFIGGINFVVNKLKEKFSA